MNMKERYGDTAVHNTQCCPVLVSGLDLASCIFSQVYQSVLLNWIIDSVYTDPVVDFTEHGVLLVIF